MCANQTHLRLFTRKRRVNRRAPRSYTKPTRRTSNRTCHANIDTCMLPSGEAFIHTQSLLHRQSTKAIDTVKNKYAKKKHKSSEQPYMHVFGKARSAQWAYCAVI